MEDAHVLKTVLVIAGMLLAGNANLAAEESAGPDLAELVRHADASKAELFAMCCWAKGRSGFQHCAEYGVCVDSPDKTCVGRGPSEGKQMSCASPPGDRPKGRP